MLDIAGAIFFIYNEIDLRHDVTIGDGGIATTSPNVEDRMLCFDETVKAKLKTYRGPIEARIQIGD